MNVSRRGFLALVGPALGKPSPTTTTTTTTTTVPSVSFYGAGYAAGY